MVYIDTTVLFLFHFLGVYCMDRLDTLLYSHSEMGGV